MAWPRLWPARDSGMRPRRRASAAVLLADFAEDIAVEYDLEGRILYVSPPIAALGHRPDDLIGQTIFDLVHPEAIAQIEERLTGLRHGMAPRSIPDGELRVRRADGDWAWVEGKPAAVRDRSGRVRGVVTILRDVTERRVLEQRAADALERLRESEMRYRILAEASPDIIIRYDLEGRIEYLSPAVRRYGQEPEALIGRNVAELLSDDEQARNLQFLADLAAGRHLVAARRHRACEARGRLA